jgi:tryptophanyl-tRNA synthetase
LKEIAEAYTTGKMLSGEIKQLAINEIIKVLDKHKLARSEITADLYKSYFTIKVQPNVKEEYQKFYDTYLKIDVEF